jgi:NADPH2:quinone reductase
MRLPNDWAARCCGPHRHGINKRQSACGANNVAYVRSLGADRVIDYTTEVTGRAIRDWSAKGVDVVLDLVGSTTLAHPLDMLRLGGRQVSILTVTADGDIERDRKEAEGRRFRKITFIIDFERARDSMREITNLIDAGLVHVPPIEMLPLEDATRVHRMIETGHVRGKLVLKVAELSA